MIYGVMSEHKVCFRPVLGRVCYQWSTQSSFILVAMIHRIDTHCDLTNPATFRTNPVIYRTNPVILSTVPFIFRINPVLFRTNTGIYRTNTAIISTDADSRTDTNLKRLRDLSIFWQKYCIPPE